MMRKSEVIWGPGTHLLWMTGWWILPFFVIAIAKFPIAGHVKSYLPFAIAFAVTMLVSVLFNLISAKRGLWARLGHWGKCCSLAAAYMVNVVAILALTLTLDSLDMIEYFGSCPAGSFGMLYIPSVLFYWVGGLAVALVLTLARKGRSSAGSTGPREPDPRSG